jgi:hypothetical protein
VALGWHAIVLHSSAMSSIIVCGSAHHNRASFRVYDTCVCVHIYTLGR